MKYHLAIRGFSEEVWRGNIVDPEIYLYCFPHDSEPTHTMSILTMLLLQCYSKWVSWANGGDYLNSISRCSLWREQGFVDEELL